MSKIERIAALSKLIEEKRVKVPETNKLVEELLFFDSQRVRPEHIPAIKLLKA